MRRFLLIPLFVLAGCGGCVDEGTRCDESTLEERMAPNCHLEGFDDRPYVAHIPADYDDVDPPPLVLLLHGGGGRAANAATVSCPDGDATHPECLHRLALSRGWVVVLPNGTPARILPNLRTWNGGGGDDGWQCVSGRACKEGIDDIAYFDALLEDLRRWLPYDRSRVFATGISNGGAMSHRLACERAGDIAAIAPVGGANQLAAVQGCEPDHPVAVMQIHGTEDPCWAYAGGESACAQMDGGRKVDVETSTERWAGRNGCSTTPTLKTLPDSADDGMTTTRVAYANCSAGGAVELLRIDGGGHTWPNGHPYLSEDRVGPVTHDWGSERILNFFAEHGR